MPMSNHGVHRTVPVETAIMNETHRADWEELSTLIEQTGGPYCVTKCICRDMREMRGEGSGEASKEWCLGLGHYAAYAIRTGHARELTKEEFLQKLRDAEKRGFVHNVSNANGPSPIEYICNCDFKSCYTLRAALYSHNPSIVRSNFTAQVDPDKCMACGSCVETCPMNAAKLGQRLPSKANGGIEYKDSLNPHNELVWGPEHHDPDYLLHRKNTWEETGTAPCKSNCPAHIGIAGYMHLAALGRYREALELIKKDNPFPAICGSVCNRRCEHVCTRGGVDEPVAIDEIKKFVAWQELNEEDRYVPEKIHKEGKKVAVIGAGPAGLSCAYYLAVLGHQVTVFEKEGKLGGMMRFGIPSFHLEKDIIDAEIDVLRRLGVKFTTGVEIGKDITLDDLRNKENFKAFYIAIGGQDGRRLGLPGEDSEGIMAGIEFMRRIALKDDYQLHGNVVVIGGGNVATNVARSAVRSGADKVSLFCLESRENMPASIDEIEGSESEGITINCGWGPMAIETKDGKISRMVFKKCLSTTDENGKFAPKFDEEDKFVQDADYVLVCIGQSVRWGSLLDGSAVKLRGNKTAEADNFTYQTAQPDIFVGGDAAYGPKFTIDAIASGKQGAESIHRFVWGHDLELGRDRLAYEKYMDRDDADVGEFDNAKRQQPTIDSAKKLTFSDERKVFTAEQVRKEANRCLRCGATHVDQGMCIGCGICTTRCKFDAIHLTKRFDCTPVPRELLMRDIGIEVERRKKLFAEKAAAGQK